MNTTCIVMPLIPELLRFLHGCQVELKRWGKPAYRFVGEVKTSALRGELLILNFAWLLRDTRFPLRGAAWQVSLERGYTVPIASTMITAQSVANIRGNSADVQPLFSRDIEIVTFLPPGEQLIDHKLLGELLGVSL